MLKRNYVMHIDIKIEEKETDGVVFAKTQSYDLPENTDFEKKFVRVGVSYNSGEKTID